MSQSQDQHDIGHTRSVARDCDSHSSSEDDNQQGNYVDEELNNAFSPESSHSQQASSLQALFPNTVPAALPTPPTTSSGCGHVGRWQIPDHYRAHWERVAEGMRLIPINVKGYEAACMTPSVEHEGKMFSESKCFSLVPRSSLDHLAGPHDGVTYSFVCECLSEIPNHALKVMYFFDTVRIILQSQDRSPFVFPTDKIGLSICRKTKKTVTGLYSKTERWCPEVDSEDMPGESGGGSGSGARHNSIRRILEARAYEQPEETKCPISEVQITWQMTGVEHMDSNGRKRHRNVCVVHVTPAANLAFWSFIFEVVLCPPKLNSPHHSTQMEVYQSMKTTLEEILNYEMVINLGILHHEFGNWNDYRFNSGGILGVNTLLSMFTIPAKISHIILKDDPGASDIKIIGVPPLDFKNDDVRTSDWNTLMHRNITAIQRMEDRDAEILQRYNSMKDKSMFEDAKQEAVGGWPLLVTPNGSVLAYGFPPFPVTLKFKSHLNAVKSFDNWFSSVGGKDTLPVLVRALLRSYLTDVNAKDDAPEIDHFLVDRRVADPVLLYNTYFSASVDPFKALIVVNCQKIWWDGFVKDVAYRRNNGMSVDQAVDSFQRYLMGVICNHRGMIEGGTFRSKAISQMMFICDTMNVEEVCRLSDRSLFHRLRRMRARMSTNRRYDRMDCALATLLDMFQEINRSFYLNSANLAFLFELMISHLMYNFGGINDTWTYFFAMIMIMSGNGHFKVTVAGGAVIQDNRKINSTGTDNTVNRKGDIMDTIYDPLGIAHHERFLKMLGCSRFSATVFEQASNASAAPGTSSTAMELFAQPPPDLNDRPLYMTEMRNDSLNPVIKDVLQRNETSTENVALTSTDTSRGTNNRVLAVKKRTNQPRLMAACTNVLDDVFSAERTRTASVVSDVLCSGSGIPCNKRSRQQFQDISRDVNTGRHRALDDREGVSFVVFALIFVETYVGLVNRTRATPTEINQTVAAYMEWGCFFLQQYAECMMNPTVRENFSRMVQGYTSRGVALTVFIKGMDHLSRLTSADEKMDTVKALLQDVMVDGLTMSCVPYVLTRITARGLDMGMILIIMSIAEDMNVPVVSWEGLNRFFEDDEPPVEGDDHLEEYTMIRNFFVECINSRRFAPEDDADWDVNHNISCYITGEGRENLAPLHETQGYLRFSFNKDKTGDEYLLFSKIARRFLKLKGRDMFKTCHMGPETVTYKLAFEDLLKYMVDLRGLASRKMFFFRKHLTKMGLIRFMPGVTDYDDAEALPFARHVTFKESGQVKSEALAVNISLLLAIPALAGMIMVHPSVVDATAIGLVTQVLAKAPASFTPANRVRTRVFGPDSTPMQIYLPQTGRPEHFLRPQDDTFPSTGILPLARRIDRWLPEDLCHCPWLYMLSCHLSCTILEVPASAIYSPYNICPDKYYPAHVPGNEEMFVTVCADVASEKVVFYEYSVGTSQDDGGDGTVASVDFPGWEEAMREKGYVMLPLIERGGACIMVNIGTDEAPEETIGCLVKYPELNSQFDHNTGNYQALVTSDNDVVQVFFKHVIQSIIPVGTVLYLNLDVIQDHRTSRASRAAKYLFTRLNVPNVDVPVQGKIYVTASYRRHGPRSRGLAASCITFEVNPWDVKTEHLFKESPDTVVQMLD